MRLSQKDSLIFFVFLLNTVYAKETIYYGVIADAGIPTDPRSTHK